MKRVSISGSPRENVGKTDAKMHRNAGRVVCVIYGGKEQMHLTLEEIPFNKLIFTPDVNIVDIELNGKVYSTILQDVQYHPVSDKALHADFLEIQEGKPVSINLPIQFEGVAPGVIKGGTLAKKMTAIPVKGLVDDIPERFVINISKMNIGSSIKIKDVDFGKLTPKTGENNVIVSVKTSRGAVVADDEEEEGGEAEAAAE